MQLGMSLAALLLFYPGVLLLTPVDTYIVPIPVGEKTTHTRINAGRKITCNPHDCNSSDSLSPAVSTLSESVSCILELRSW